VLVTGMIIGTSFTLFVVPAIYMLIARKRTNINGSAETPAMHANGDSASFMGVHGVNL